MYFTYYTTDHFVLRTSKRVLNFASTSSAFSFLYIDPLCTSTLLLFLFLYCFVLLDIPPVSKDIICIRSIEVDLL